MAYKFSEIAAKQTLANQVDWHEIGVTYSKKLQDEADLREKEKLEIEQGTRDMVDTINSAPESQARDMTDWTFEFTESLQKNALMVHQKLKNGEIGIREFNTYMANLEQGTKQAYSTMTSWNTIYDEKLKRMRDCKNNPDVNCSSKQEQWAANQLAELGNFNATSLHINPLTGKINLAKKKLRNSKLPWNPETNPYLPGISDNPNDFAEISSLNHRINTQIDEYDVGAGVENAVETLATIYEEAKMTEGIKSVDDITQNDYFDDALTNEIEAIKQDKNAVSSILSDYVGVYRWEDEDGVERQIDYDFTTDPKEAAKSGHWILLVDDPYQPGGGGQIAQLTDEQSEVVTDAIKAKIMTSLKKKEVPMREPTDQDRDRWAEGKDAESFVSNVMAIYTGDDAAVQSTLDNLGGLNEDISSMFINADRDVVIRKVGEGGKMEEVIITVGDKTPRQFLESIITHVSGKYDIKDLNKAITNAGFYEGAVRGDGTGTYGVKVTEKKTPYSELGDVVLIEGDKSTSVPLDTKWDKADLAQWGTKYRAKEGTELFTEQITVFPEAETSGGITKTIQHKTLKDSGLDNTYALTQIYYPELMTAPILVPAIKGGNYKIMLRAIHKRLYDYVGTDGKIRPTDFKDILGEHYDTYINEKFFTELDLGEFNGGYGPAANQGSDVPIYDATGDRAQIFNIKK